MLQTSSKVVDDLFLLCFTFNAPFFEARVWMISCMESVPFKDRVCFNFNA